VSNQEVMYDTSSALSRYQSETTIIPSFDTMASMQNMTNKSAAQVIGSVGGKRRRTA